MTWAVVPAAGLGSRLQSGVPKALVHLNGRPLIERVLASLDGAVEGVTIVINPAHHELFHRFVAAIHLPYPVSFAAQQVPAGSRDAVARGVDLVLGHHPGCRGIVVVWADQVGVSSDAIRRIVALIAADQGCLAVPAMSTVDPYIHMAISADQRIERVQRRRDGSSLPDVGLTDLGVFGLGSDLARRFIRATDASGREDSHEDDFVYCLPWLSTNATQTHVIHRSDTTELIGINTESDLENASSRLC